MDGGVAVLVSIIVLLVVGGIALAVYGTGGLLRQHDDGSDRR